MRDNIVWIAKLLLLYSRSREQTLIDVVWLEKTQDRKKRPKEAINISKLIADLMECLPRDSQEVSGRRRSSASKEKIE
jgi:hypothetical protein